jgi:hypothetical protein
MARTSIILLTLFLLSCGPASKLRRAERLISKAEEKGATWRVDTVYTQVPVIVSQVKKDTVFESLPGDTVVIEKERLKVKYVKLPGDSVFIEGECKADTVYKEVPVTVTKTIEAKGGIKWYWLVVVAFVALLIGLFKK